MRKFLTTTAIAAVMMTMGGLSAKAVDDHQQAARLAEVEPVFVYPPLQAGIRETGGAPSVPNRSAVAAGVSTGIGEVSPHHLGNRGASPPRTPLRRPSRGPMIPTPLRRLARCRSLVS